ncbi:ImmA/IrrE family metallo-endopeptidase [Massilia timonae]|uniref:ImmA/IrrE family metallo-endopeptidase n=1 Tax=Massilia timonae TaxID=47229 RepID=UPI0009F2A1A8|nr:ImmA/IrrE family metallo-endopeptidase [Massilia timonae]
MNTVARPRYSVIAREVSALLAKLPSQNAPIPVDKLAGLCGATIVYNDFKDEISGLLFRDAGKLIIGVASEQSVVRQRFTIAHELGHALLHQISTVHIDKSFSVMFRSAASSTAQDVHEIEANTFAAELLMPESLLKTDLLTLKLDMEDDEQLSALAERYGVSTQALTYRLLNLISRNRLLI